MTRWPAGARAALVDVDGTLLDGERAVPGAGEAMLRLRRAGIPFRLTTNTSRRPRRETAAALRAAGIEVADGEVLQPASLARSLILESGRPRAALLVPEGSREDLAGVIPDEEAPDWLVMGDLGDGFTYARMNAAFRLLRRGARLLALHRNPFWQAGEEGELLDAGAYVAALEYAAGVQATLVGKPSRDFFHLALRDLAVPPSATAVIGDDPEADIAGGGAAGCLTVHVRTGKGRAAQAPATLSIASIADLFP